MTSARSVLLLGGWALGTFGTFGTSGTLGPVVTFGGSPVSADPGPALAALAPAEDARKAVALGPSGEVYAPDPSGAWIRSQAISTADPLALAGRAGGSIVAIGDGVVYRLADNGWTAIRLVQKGKADEGAFCTTQRYRAFREFEPSADFAHFIPLAARPRAQFDCIDGTIYYRLRKR